MFHDPADLLDDIPAAKPDHGPWEQAPAFLDPERGQPSCYVVYFGLSHSFPHYDTQVEWDMSFSIDISHLPSLSIRGIW